MLENGESVKVSEANKYDKMAIELGNCNAMNSYGTPTH